MICRTTHANQTAGINGTKYLKSVKVLDVEIVHRVVQVLALEPAADLAIHQAALNLAPVIGVVHPLLQPIGVIPKSVLLVTPAGEGLAGALVGDDEGEDREAKEEDDEEEHD